MSTFTTPAPDSGNCNPNFGTQGQKGVTIWGPLTTPITIAPGVTSDPYYFTLTEPQCYQGPTQVCNVNYTINTTTNSAKSDVGPIWMAINQNPNNDINCPNNPYPAGYASDRYHSSIAYHDVTETIDISQSNVLNQFGANYLRFTNCSDVTVYIYGLKIIRIYQMEYLPASSCSDNGTSYPPHPDFATRYDYPCNWVSCGGMSTNDFGTDNHVTTISPGQTQSWTWTNPENPSNGYSGPISCLFNFNNVALNVIPSGTLAENSDEKFSIQVNNSDWVDFYHTRYAGHHMAHSVDLATDPVLSASGGYNDAPNATNVLRFTLDQSATYSLALCDGCGSPNCSCPSPDCCPTFLASNCNGCCSGMGGNVNIYRVYQTVPVCPETFTITVQQSTGGQISPSSVSPVMAYGFSPTFTITPNAGYSNSGVYVNGVYQGAPIEYITLDSITQPTTISATFAQQCYVTVTCYPSQGGSVTPPTESYACNSNVTFTANPSSGYAFDHWVFDPSNNGGDYIYYSPVTLNNLSGTHTMDAYFTPTFTITASAGSNGSIYPSGAVQANYNTTPTFYINSATGYMIEDVQVDGTSVGAVGYYTFPPVQANHTISATFCQAPLTVYAYVEGENWYQLNPNIYVDGNCVGTAPQTIQLPLGPHTVSVDDPTQDTLAPGFDDSFDYFSDQNNNVYSNGQSIQITAATTLTANYIAGY